MDEQYWKGRWERGETGWHQAEVEHELVSRMSDLEPTRVLVPLCGKSLDLAWLARRGHEVVGVELAEKACRAFFAESGIACSEERRDGMTVFRGGGVTIFNTDFFRMTPELVGRIGAVYDRAALIALPRELRARYAAHLTQLVKASLPGREFRFLQIVLERTPHDENGPPHSVTAAELEALYGREFRIVPLSREKAGIEGAPPTDQCVYRIEPPSRTGTR